MFSLDVPVNSVYNCIHYRSENVKGGWSWLTRLARRLLTRVPDWHLVEDGGKIERTFQFGNFREALDFAREVGELAETERHHPEIAFGWGHATISLRTKKIKGLHENDFIMAAKIDRIAIAAGARDDRAAHPASDTRTSNRERDSAEIHHS